LTDSGKRQEEQFRELVHRQSRFVFRVAYAVLRNVQDAEDVVQETFLKLHRSAAWASIREERPFLARTAWRLAVDRFPRRMQDISCEDADPVELVSHVASPEQVAMVQNSRELVHRLIDSLPEELRQPLALSTIEEMSSPEIASAMGIPEGTVRTRLMRGRALLKEKLAGVLEGRYAR
jgi:RNA polymerase sigma-70 factor, ECF subfamily